MKIDILLLLEKSANKIQASLKSYKKNWYITWVPIYIYDNISFSSFYSEKYLK